MPVLILAAGAAAGAFFYFNRHEFGAWLLWGGLLAVLWLRDQRLEKRLERSEAALEELKRAATPPASRPQTQPAAVTTTLRQASTPVPTAGDDFIFEPLRPSSALTPGSPGTAPRPTTPPRPATPAPSASRDKEPAFDLWQIVVSYFTGGNVIVRAGVIVLFFGVAFLLKYSAERNIIPIELRLLGVAASAIALLLFGWRLRLSRPGYALIVQGGAVGVLYLTIFAALRLYQLLPVGFALALLVVMSIASAALAILQDARMLAVIGIIGGFLAPVLTSTGGGSHIMLFSYYALLNLGIVLIAWHRSWRELNLVGFLFTFGIGTAWGFGSYRPDLFWSTEAFLLLFFVFYLVIGLLFARNQTAAWQGYVDGSMVFGTPIICFALQAGLVKPYEYGLAWSALALGLLYSLLAAALVRRAGRAWHTLASAYIAIGVVFGTVAIPLALDGRWTAAAWALEGAALLWIAVRQQRWLARISGLVLQILAGGAFLDAMHEPTSLTPVINGVFLGAGLIAVAGLFSGYYLHRHRDRFASAPAESLGAFAWGLLWWFGNGLHEIELHVLGRERFAVAIAFITLSSLLAYLCGSRANWPHLRRVYFGLTPALYGALAFCIDHTFRHPSLYGGAIAWPLAFAILFSLLHQDEQSEPQLPTVVRWLHILTFWLLLSLVTWEIAWWTDHLVDGAGVWPFVVIGIVPALFLLALCLLRNLPIWPLRSHLQSYLQIAAAPIAVLLWLGALGTSLVSRGDPWPLMYLPLLNPLDLAQAGVLAVLGIWLFTVYNHLKTSPLGLNRFTLVIISAGSLFWWLNAAVVRALHHLGKIPFHLHSMVNSDLAQTTFSIFWTVTALLVMWSGARRGLRPIWLIGSALIALVIVKLFTFDLANTSTVERIISFIGVGLLCLLVGYLAPLPPHRSDEGDPS
jgi:uncharacterized membrane protein